MNLFLYLRKKFFEPQLRKVFKDVVRNVRRGYARSVDDVTRTEAYIDVVPALLYKEHLLTNTIRPSLWANL